MCVPTLLAQTDLSLLNGPLLPSLWGWSGNLMAAGLTLLVFWVAWRLIRTGLRPVLERSRLDVTSTAFVTTAVKYVVFAIGFVTALGEAGVNTMSMVASLGVAGLTVGFAARETLANVIAGLFIYWDRPFVIDDLVEIEDVYGRVDRITLRSTRVVTPDGRMVAVPNSQAAESPVASYTNFPHLRLEVSVDVGVDEDLGRVRQLLLEVVRERDGFLEEPEPSVSLTALGDYTVTVSLMAWVDDERTHRDRRSELREAAYEKLRSAGVDMPNETFSLTPVEVRRSA